MKLKIICLLFIFSFSVSKLQLKSQSDESWKASEAVVHQLSSQRADINYYEEKVASFVLPDPLLSIEGKRITRKDEWNVLRREEILDLFRENVFGRVPETSYSEKFRILNKNTSAIGSTAILKQVGIDIKANGKTITINLTLFTPDNGGKPVPVFLLIDNRGPANTDPERKTKSEFWPVEDVLARGYGIAVFYNADVDPDTDDGFKNGIHALLDQGERKGDSWGTLAAWAWGASRCLDYLITDKDVDASKIAVLGHSRGGKAALWAGAQDERFAMVISNESGCGGAALARRKYGETIKVINKTFPHWFCTNYRKYNDNENSLPLDMHMLLGLTAPRPLYVACAGDDLWGDPKGSYLALYNAFPIFKLLGNSSLISETMPPLNKQVVYGNVGFHVRDGGHNMLLKDWNKFMDFADVEFLKK
jgi:pimeloyl-ACP methyl ester carboxylesterase